MNPSQVVPSKRLQGCGPKKVSNKKKCVRPDDQSSSSNNDSSASSTTDESPFGDEAIETVGVNQKVGFLLKTNIC